MFYSRPGAAAAQRRAGQGSDAFAYYLDDPEVKRRPQLSYDREGRRRQSGFGIGSAGLPAYNLLVEGFNQALDNDVVLSMKQANVPAVSRIVDHERGTAFFEHEGHRTVVTQRGLQVHTDPLLGWTTVDGVGYVVAEVSPYEVDLDWDEITEPDEIEPVVDLLGRATAKVHCVSDEDSDEDLVDFQTEEAIIEAIDADPEAFVDGSSSSGSPTLEPGVPDHGRCSSRAAAPSPSPFAPLVKVTHLAAPRPAGMPRAALRGERRSR